jgi:hypothetical protein
MIPKAKRKTPMQEAVLGRLRSTVASSSPGSKLPTVRQLIADS